MSSSVSDCKMEGRYRLVRNLKVILEALLWYKRTLRDKCWTVVIICMLLKETMPVLWENTSEMNLHTPKIKLTMEVAKSRVSSSSLSATLMLKVSPYNAER